MKKTVRAGSAALLWLLALSIQAQDAPPASEPLIGPIATPHHITMQGRRFGYTATFVEIPLGGTPAHPEASMSSITYVRTDAGLPDGKRPVVFVFNGGPGASSSPLHLHALGPRRIVEADASHGKPFIADNPDTLLDVADLVFIDPVGTGLSRVLPGGDGHPYWGPDGDAKAVLGYIRSWLKEHSREASPIYIVGESYGGYRLATMMKFVGDQRFDGLILISPLLNQTGGTEAPGNDQAYINSLPSMAAAAWFQQRVDRRGLSVSAFVAEAETFAANDYVAALQAGSSLPAARENAVAQRLASFTGVPAERLVAKRLRFGSEEYLNTLVADQGQRAGRLDTRVTGPLHQKAPPGVPTNDPSLTIARYSDLADQYFRQELKVPSARRYIGVAFDVNLGWNWEDDRDPDRGRRFYVTAAPYLGEALTSRPKARLLLVSGLFDMATPWYGTAYALDHAGIPPGQMSSTVMETGHSPYEGEENLHRFSTLLHAFIIGAPTS